VIGKHIRIMLITPKWSHIRHFGVFFRPFLLNITNMIYFLCLNIAYMEYLYYLCNVIQRNPHMFHPLDLAATAIRHLSYDNNKLQPRRSEEHHHQRVQRKGLQSYDRSPLSDADNRKDHLRREHSGSSLRRC